MVVSAVLRSAVRVMNAARRRPSDGDGHVQRSQGKILLHAVADGPANDAPREKVQCHGQIDPAFPRPDISDVARPVLVRPARGNVLLQEIRRDVDGRSARHDVDVRRTGRARAATKAAGVPSVAQSNKVKVVHSAGAISTMHFAKGLEFRTHPDRLKFQGFQMRLAVRRRLRSNLL